MSPADPADIAATRAFARYAVDRADSNARARRPIARSNTQRRSAQE
jgi:hypothetical protein